MVYETQSQTTAYFCDDQNIQYLCYTCHTYLCKRRSILYKIIPYHTYLLTETQRHHSMYLYKVLCDEKATFIDLSSYLITLLETCSEGQMSVSFTNIVT